MVYVVLKRILEPSGGLAKVVAYSPNYDRAVAEMVKQAAKILETLSILELKIYKPGPNHLILATPERSNIQFEFQVQEVPEITET